MFFFSPKKCLFKKKKRCLAKLLEENKSFQGVADTVFQKLKLVVYPRKRFREIKRLGQPLIAAQKCFKFIGLTQTAFHQKYFFEKHLIN